MRAIVLTSLTTGLFCAIFAGAVDLLTDALTRWQVIGLGALSGATGSLIAQLTVGWKR